jgi:hypothetical protein
MEAVELCANEAAGASIISGDFLPGGGEGEGVRVRLKVTSPAKIFLLSSLSFSFVRIFRQERTGSPERSKQPDERER